MIGQRDRQRPRQAAREIIPDGRIHERAAVVDVLPLALIVSDRRWAVDARGEVSDGSQNGNSGERRAGTVVRDDAEIIGSRADGARC